MAKVSAIQYLSMWNDFICHLMAAPMHGSFIPLSLKFLIFYRADLEAAAKARSKISNAGQSASDAQKISKIYTQLTDLDGFLAGTSAANAERSEGSASGTFTSSNNNDVLSTIVNRLAACAELHSSSSEFGNDLKALEEMLTDTQVLLSGLETTVATLETGMEENMKVIASNIENLDKQ